MRAVSSRSGRASTPEMLAAWTSSAGENPRDVHVWACAADPPAASHFPTARGDHPRGHPAASKASRACLLRARVSVALRRPSRLRSFFCSFFSSASRRRFSAAASCATRVRAIASRRATCSAEFHESLIVFHRSQIGGRPWGSARSTPSPVSKASLPQHARRVRAENGCPPCRLCRRGRCVVSSES